MASLWQNLNPSSLTSCFCVSCQCCLADLFALCLQKYSAKKKLHLWNSILYFRILNHLRIYMKISGRGAFRKRLKERKPAQWLGWVELLGMGRDPSACEVCHKCPCSLGGLTCHLNCAGGNQGLGVCREWKSTKSSVKSWLLNTGL